MCGAFSDFFQVQILFNFKMDLPGDLPTEKTAKEPEEGAQQSVVLSLTFYFYLSTYLLNITLQR